MCIRDRRTVSLKMLPESLKYTVTHIYLNISFREELTLLFSLFSIIAFPKTVALVLFDNVLFVSHCVLGIVKEVTDIHRKHLIRVTRKQYQIHCFHSTVCRCHLLPLCFLYTDVIYFFGSGLNVELIIFYRNKIQCLHKVFL